MNRPELYQKTVDILYAAYFNDTLQHRNCYACAVGNIIASNCGIDHRLYNDAIIWADSTPAWFEVFVTVEGNRLIRPDGYKGLAKHQIDSTGYKWGGLSEIESAFEMADPGVTDEDWMFNGLIAVLDALTVIHEITDTDEINNDRFREHYNRKVAVTN